ncbi:MAG TPA: (Fe-S)-binding protein [Anaerolineales bacterium]|nr:(Fe-S)-binding protein [Anaerolineales bacterium]
MSAATETALQVLERQLNGPLLAALEVCARCAICAETCHYYRAEPAAEHIPAARGEALRRVYRAEHDWLSRLFPAWTGAERLTDDTLASLAEMAFSRCTLCRRCTFNCPMGVDTPLLMRTVRAMATAGGMAPEMLVMLADAAIEKGKDPSFFRDMFVSQIPDLEKELQASTGDRTARITVGREGAKVLYVALAGVHTIVPPAIIFQAAGEDWTLSIYEASNYGVFLGDVERAKQIAARIINEAKALRVQELVLAECGHAYAALRWEAPNWFGETFPFKVTSLVEKMDQYLAEGRLRLDPSANPQTITYHDSCNMARSGGVIEEPRRLLRAITRDFVEMTPNRLEAYCCGGGGGLVALPEYEETRLKAGSPKADQIRRSGAEVVVAACENCRLQIGDLNHHYGLGVEVSALADLVVKAMRLPSTPAEAEKLFASAKSMEPAPSRDLPAIGGEPRLPLHPPD